MYSIFSNSLCISLSTFFSTQIMDCGSVAGNMSRNSCYIYNTPQNIFYPQNPSDLTAERVMYLFTSHVREEWSVHLWEHVINHGVLRPRVAAKALCVRAHVHAVLMCACGTAANHVHSELPEVQHQLAERQRYMLQSHFTASRLQERAGVCLAHTSS